MQRKVVKIRIYPTDEQQGKLAQTFGCARWWWNFALNKSIETYRETGSCLGRSALNAFLPALKKSEETKWLGDCYSQVLQATTLNLTTAYKNFFEGRAKFPKFKSKKGKQSAQYPQNVTVSENAIHIPGGIGEIKASVHRPIDGKIKTVTISKTPSGKYFASALFEAEGESPASAEGKIYGIDLGVKHFAVVSDGEKISKYDNPKHLAKHEKNLKRKQQKLSRQKEGSKTRERYRKLVARYADDMVLVLKPNDDEQKILDKISQFLAERGMKVSEKKTKITAATDGFDFLGWHFKVQKNGKFRSQPSVENFKKFREKVKKIVNNSNYGTKVKAEKLAPIVRGWKNYHQFCKLDGSRFSLWHINKRTWKVFNKERKLNRYQVTELVNKAFPNVPYHENKFVNVKGVVHLYT